MRIKSEIVIRKCLWCDSEFESTNTKRYRKCCCETCSHKYSSSKRTEEWRIEMQENEPKKWLEYRRNMSIKAQERNRNRPKISMKKKPFELLCWESKRERILEEQGCKCGKCNLSEWMGVLITFEVDHIDGDNKNDSRENLIGLCPNCHSITPTWRGRNIAERKKITDEIAIEALKSSPSIRQALIKCGLAPKGGNYKRFTQLQNNLRHEASMVSATL